MRYKIDHDYHIHTCLSVCSSDAEQTPKAILEIAKKRGLRKIVITDHYWDERVLCNTQVNFWYEKQNHAHVCQALPMPKDDCVACVFGCEVDMDSDGRIGVSEERFDAFGFIVVSTTHFHHMGGPEWEDMTSPAVAKRWVNRFDALLASNLPFHKTGFAHPACGLISMHSRQRYLDALNAIPNNDLERLFAKAAKVGIGIELNYDDMCYTDQEADTVLRMFKTAKYCGCKFYLGSDAHKREAFDGVDEVFERAITALDLKESDKFEF